MTGLLDAMETIEQGRGPAIALAHGAGGGVRLNFDALITRLQAGRTLIGVNYPGSGASPMTDLDLDLTSLADTVVAAMVVAGHERFPIVGLSLGTAVAITAAVRHPDHVTGLVLTVGLGLADEQAKGFVAVWQRLAALGEWETLAQHLVNASSPEVLAAMTPQQMRSAVAATAQNYPAGGSVQAGLAATVDVRELLDQVAVPTLVFAAGQDRVVLPSTTRALAAAIPGAELVEYPRAGHIFTAAENATWTGDVAGFLARHDL